MSKPHGERVREREREKEKRKSFAYTIKCSILLLTYTHIARLFWESIKTHIIIELKSAMALRSCAVKEGFVSVAQ
jgi:hypothetical protein